MNRNRPARETLRDRALRASRRNFMTGAAAAAGTLAASGAPAAEKQQIENLARLAEKASYLAFFDPADGSVPNPGMGVSGYVHSDHMYAAYTEEEVQRARRLPPLALDRAAFDRFIELPYLDNLYLRYDWRDLQKEKGKLHLPEDWKWTLEACERRGKRWSFRIMNCTKGSMRENSMPDFLQGKLKMVRYWNDPGTRGPNPKSFPEYSDEYLDLWNELTMLLGAAFDKHPLLEYVDISGYGFWGEWHNIARYTGPEGPQTNYHPSPPGRVEAVADRLIRDHLAAFPTTPAVLNIHAAEYEAGQRAFAGGLVWARRDSFRYGFSTTEVRLAQGIKPGNAMVWEIIRPGIYCPRDDAQTEEFYPLPQRYFDISAHYAAMGFNAWDAIWAHKNCLKTYKAIEQHIGYRIRPSIVWRRKLRGKDEIVLGLRNDGCVGPPGRLTIRAVFPGGKESSVELPAGEPAPGAMKMYALPFLEGAGKDVAEKTFELSMRLKMKGKQSPVRWAVKKKQAADEFDLKIPLKGVS